MSFKTHQLVKDKNIMKLFSWGTNSHGQLGLGFESELEPIPKEVPLQDLLKNSISKSVINGGGNHSIICCNGKIWGAGLNTDNQLCSSEMGKSSNSFIPLLQMGTREVSAVSCGWDFSLLLANDGGLYGYGSNAFNQLGSHSQPNMPQSENLVFSQVSAGLRNGAAVTNTGLLQMWGADKYVTHISGLSGISKVTCGQRHILALDHQNNLLAWGANNHGQCGQNSAVSRHVQNPSVIDWDERNGKVVDVASGWTHCILLTDHGHVYTWGRNTYGQLGRISDSSSHVPVRIPELDGITCIVSGSEHCLALNKLGELWTWGWNEHGSCGNGNVENQHRPVNISHHFSGKVHAIGSGAGHSFAVVE